MAVIWSDLCIPQVTNATRDPEYRDCCSAKFDFSLTTPVPAGVGGSTYYPNKCDPTWLTTDPVTIGPMVVDMVVISAGIEVDDELLLDGEVFQPGLPQYAVTLSSGNNGGDGSFFPGGPSLCNGRHVIPEGTVLVSVPRGTSLELRGGDNHGISLMMEGSVIVRAVGPP